MNGQHQVQQKYSDKNDYIDFPHTFGQWYTRGKWRPYPWLKYLSNIVADRLAQGGARLLITAPPQHGKSEFISKVVPTWYLNLRPEHRVILTSYSQRYADKFGMSVRANLTENDRSFVRIRHDTASKQRFVTAAGGGMITAGIGGPVTGEPAELFIVDDPVKNYEDAMSARKRETNMDWIRSVMTTRLQAGSSAIIMHTRWHEADIIGELSKQGDRWELINLPAVAELNDPMGRSMGDALCPERFDAKELGMKRKDVGEMMWSALYQGDPVATGGMIVKGDWIKRHNLNHTHMDELAVFADLTYEKKEENDFTVIELWGRKGVNIYLLEQIRAQMGFQDQIIQLGFMFQTHPRAFHKEIEKKANGAAVIEMVQAKYPGVIANNPKTEKSARLAAVAPLYHAGNVHYPDETKPENAWVKVNIDEVTKMGPGGSRAKHDDTVDCATMAVAHFGKLATSMQAIEALGRR